MTTVVAPADLNDFDVWVSRYKDALLAVESKIPAKVKEILIAHACAFQRRLSVLEMGQVAGYKGDRAASLQYGKFARALSKHLPEETLSAPIDQLSHIGLWDKTPNIKGHGSWVMYEELAVALQELGWIKGLPSEIYQKQEAKNLVTVRQMEVSTRVGQDVFRSAVIDYWGSCCVTGCELHEVLVASHIVPWSQATDQERMDVYNGLLLTPNLDRLFDRYLISFEEHGYICIAPKLNEQLLNSLSVTPSMKLRDVTPNYLHYLSRHLEVFKKTHGL